MVAVFLHLLLGVLQVHVYCGHCTKNRFYYLRALEGEVLEPGQHPTPGVHRAHQLVGGAWKRVEMNK